MARFTQFFFMICLLGLVHKAMTAEQCNGPRQFPIRGKRLVGHTYETRWVRSGYAECLFVCREEKVCQSFNFVSESICEFNNRTKEDCSPEDFVSDPLSRYVKTAIGPIDECTDNTHECHANAKCISNKTGPYSCKCKPDYYGDGWKRCTHATDLTGSTILSGDSRYLKNLTLFLKPVVNLSNIFVRCWHAKEDGWAASTFHSNCDDKGPTVTLIQVESLVFGGYSDVSWKAESNSCQYGYSRKAFIFSLNNGSGQYNPVKRKVEPSWFEYAVYSCASDGPRFGGIDIYIPDNAASGRSSITHCGYTYPLPEGYSKFGRECTFYAGTYNFTPTDIEVFYVKNT